MWLLWQLFERHQLPSADCRSESSELEHGPLLFLGHRLLVAEFGARKAQTLSSTRIGSWDLTI